jgi:hypothetical protein
MSEQALAKLLTAWRKTRTERLEWLWATPIGGQHLTLIDQITRLGAWLAWADEQPRRLASLTVSDTDAGRGWHATLTRGADGRLSKLDLICGELHHHSTSNIEQATEALAALPPGTITSFTLHPSWRLFGMASKKLAALQQAIR